MYWKCKKYSVADQDRLVPLAATIKRGTIPTPQSERSSPELPPLPFRAFLGSGSWRPGFVERTKECPHGLASGSLKRLPILWSKYPVAPAVRAFEPAVGPELEALGEQRVDPRGHRVECRVFSSTVLHRLAPGIQRNRRGRPPRRPSPPPGERQPGWQRPALPSARLRGNPASPGRGIGNSPPKRHRHRSAGIRPPGATGP